MQGVAFITVTDKRGIAELVRGFAELGMIMIASEGTADHLRKEVGVFPTPVAEYTGQRPLIQPQGIKSIHPKVFAGILGNSGNPAHKEDFREAGIVPIDIVICNFYPFEEMIEEGSAKFSREEMMLNIDIGGPAMVVCAVKGGKIVVVDPDDYPTVLAELRASGDLSEKTRTNLSRKAMQAVMNHYGSVFAYV